MLVKIESKSVTLTEGSRRLLPIYKAKNVDEDVITVNIYTIGGGVSSVVVDRSAVEEIQYALVCFLNSGEFDRDN